MSEKGQGPKSESKSSKGSAKVVRGVDDRLAEEGPLRSAGVVRGWTERMPQRQRQAVLAAHEEDATPEMSEDVSRYYIHLAQ